MRRLIALQPARLGTSPGHSLRKEQRFAIGVYEGPSPLHLQAARGARNPVLTCDDVVDADAAFVADPFMLRTELGWCMFFEVLNRVRGKGEIALATSRTGIRWRYCQIVLRETFHLSYPYVFRAGETYYMIPESYPDNSVRLYKADEFPTRWSFVAKLLDGRDWVDSSIFRFGQHWWLFAGLGAPPLRADTLRLYFAEELTGPWREHPKSPVVDGDIRRARPGGRILVDGATAIRYTQDCSLAYGRQVRAFQITELTPETYQEHEVGTPPILTGSGKGWNGGGMHHVDAHRLDDARWIACVDGWREVEVRGGT